jgi:hypothetical protein
MFYNWLVSGDKDKYSSYGQGGQYYAISATKDVMVYRVEYEINQGQVYVDWVNWEEIK